MLLIPFIPSPSRMVDWLSDGLDNLATWTGFKAEPQEQPEPVGFYVDGAGNRRAIDPETGYPIATASEKQDIVAGIRGPAIQALENEARKRGEQLPQDFVEYMRFEDNPRWCMNGVGVSIFLAKGELNPDVYDNIIEQIGNGKLEEKSARRVECRQQQRQQIAHYGEGLLNILEDMNEKDLPPEVKEALIKDGKFAYRDEHGNQRMVDFTRARDLRFMIAEVRELSQNFLNGVAPSASEGQLDAMQNIIDRRIAAKGNGQGVG